MPANLPDRDTLAGLLLDLLALVAPDVDLRSVPDRTDLAGLIADKITAWDAFEAVRCPCGTGWWTLIGGIDAAGHHVEGQVSLGLTGSVHAYSGRLLCPDCGRTFDTPTDVPTTVANRPPLTLVDGPRPTIPPPAGHPSLSGASGGQSERPYVPGLPGSFLATYANGSEQRIRVGQPLASTSQGQIVRLVVPADADLEHAWVKNILRARFASTVETVHSDGSPVEWPAYGPRS